MLNRRHFIGTLLATASAAALLPPRKSGATAPAEPLLKSATAHRAFPTLSDGLKRPPQHRRAIHSMPPFFDDPCL